MNTNNLKQFEDYYNGEMGPEEKASFEESLLKDPALNASYNEYLGIYEAIADQDSLELRIKLKEIREENARKKNSSDFFGYGYNWLWMAALLTIIISFTVIVSIMITRVDNEDKFVSASNAIVLPAYSALDIELKRFEQRNVEFNLESPKNVISYTRKDPLLFRWTVNATNPLILDLIDLDGHIVFTSGKYIESPYILNKKLPEGMLVYRFRTESESFSIGFLYLR